MQKGKDIFMTTLEIQTKKDHLISDILQIEDAQILEAIERIIQGSKQKLTPPCQYSVEELRAHIDQAMEEKRLGLGKDAYEVLKEMEAWV